ncbi:MAG: malate synthase G, partial [Alphaproteobacteria bacterium]|nr:malate synthase G [Alphaproteobacteria bacterium]
MTKRIQSGGLQVAQELYDFINDEAIPGSGLDPAAFWSGLDAIVHDLASRNRDLLAHRDVLQAKIDTWHKERAGQPLDRAEYTKFLKDINYLVEEGATFSVSTENQDAEISTIAGPQLVVPVMNARYALNAANARWGSLYDALYGTDAIAEDDGAERSGGYNPTRGARVIAFARNFMDETIPLAQGSHADATGYHVENGTLAVQMTDGAVTGLADQTQFAGYQGDAGSPDVVLFVNHGLHFEIRIDRSHTIGKSDPAGISDVVLESAITTIMDCEDSIAAVDAEDKVVAYRNWLGLMKGDLTASFEKGGGTVERRLNDDRRYTAPDGGSLTLP